MHRDQAAWPHSPALLLAAAMAVGIWWADYREPPVAAVAALAGATWLLAAGARMLEPWPPAPAVRLVVACLLVACAGSVRFGSNAALPYDHSEISRTSPGEALVLWGRVSSNARTPNATRRLLLDDVRVPSSRDGRARVLAYAGEAEAWPPGTRVVLRAIALPWPEVRNPGEFDYGQFLRRRGVHLAVRVTGVLAITGDASVLRRATEAVRAHVDESLVRYVDSGPARAVLRALVLGDRSGIDPVTKESFVATGLVHLLAVSGLHVMIIGLALYRLSGPLLMRAKLTWRAVEATRTTATLVVLSTYALLTGLPPSVVRAVTMTAMLLLGGVARRRSHSLNSLGAACLILLWTSPHSLFEAGFQLSCMAVGGIIVLVPPLQRIARRLGGSRLIPETVISGVAVSTAATMATLPVLLAHFGRASLAGIPLNIPAIPLTALALSSIVLCLLTAPVPALAATFGAAAGGAIRALLRLAAAGESLLGFLTVNPSPGSALSLAILTVAIAALLATRPSVGRPSILLALLLLPVLRSRTLLAPSPFEVLFFDVGQGDGTLIRTPAGYTMLVDAGPRTERFDAGHKIIVPYLNRSRISRLDALLLTHSHADHIGGAASILRQATVGRVLITASSEYSPMMRETVHVADSIGIPIRIVVPGDTINMGPDTRGFVLAPSGALLAAGEENDRSLVLRVEYGRTSVLLMGDAEELAEMEILYRYRRMLASDVVKVGHHGSSTSSHPAFVREATPGGDLQTWAVISVARRNTYGLPSRDVLERWRRAGSHTVTTAEEGALLLASDGTAFRRVRWRDDARH